MIIPGADDATRIGWLGRHRLWPVAAFLAQRGDLPAHLAAIAEPLAERQRRDMRLQLAEDQRVVSSLAKSGVPVLVLKGALLAQAVYPTPESRFRTDLDLLVDAKNVAAIEGQLRELDYDRPEGAQSAMPLRQSQWTRRSGERIFSVDLHWDLRNHPALQARFSFSELIESSQPLPALADQALGIGPAHALLNASMHFFNDYADERPLQWLLDKDLLWRAMSKAKREYCVELACEKGLAGLLAESLRLTRDWFQSPVSDKQIETLRSAGRGQWCTGLVRANEKRHSAYWFALRSEPGLRRKIRRVRMGLFPPASYVRQHYPEGSRWRLVGLYVRRLAQKL